MVCTKKVLDIYKVIFTDKTTALYLGWVSPLERSHANWLVATATEQTTGTMNALRPQNN